MTKLGSYSNLSFYLSYTMKESQKNVSKSLFISVQTGRSVCPNQVTKLLV